MAATPAESLMVYEQMQDAGADIRVEDFAPLVKRIAHHMMVRMPACVQVDDLIQSGMIGLLEAAQKYDNSRGASFETYAGIRIRGAMVDEMRRGDWAPRSVHRNTRMVAEAVKALEARLGRDAKDTEVAEALDIDIDEYHAILRDANSARLFSLDETLDADEGQSYSNPPSHSSPGPAEAVQHSEMRAAIVEAIKTLPERDQLVLSLYYEQELNLKEIGLTLGVSESRVSQIHSQAAMRLRARLADW